MEGGRAPALEEAAPAGGCGRWKAAKPKPQRTLRMFSMQQRQWKAARRFRRPWAEAPWGAVWLEPK